MTNNTAERDLRNHWMMFGTAACVLKRGRQWAIGFGGFGFPVFHTKREAMATVDQFILEVARRNREGR